MAPKIFINGKEISSMQDLPPELRQILGDDNNNGIPDIAENPFAALGKLGDLNKLAKTLPKDLIKHLPLTPDQKKQLGLTNVVVNGKQYDDISQIPESEKAELKATLSNIKHTQDSTPAEGLSKTPLRKTSEIPVTASPAIQEKQDKNRAIIFALGIVAIVGYLLYEYLSAGNL